ncbi:MAG: Fic family protein [Peptostreptococcaceae bacterium]|nr:Fic family protein [Peptostreptococcaceae bacterium]
MNREENMFLAKKLFTELVFNTAYIEGVNVTFPQTQAIIDGAIVNNIPVSDIQTVLNLRDAWKYILVTIDDPLTLHYICSVNERVSKNESLDWGSLRNGTVGVSGTDYIPPVPQKEVVEKVLDDINKISDAKERAIEYFCYAVRGQLFWDGNKRTSTIISSKILIEAGQGVLTIGKANALNFNETLLHFYDTEDKEPLKECLRKCIKTISRGD